MAEAALDFAKEFKAGNVIRKGGDSTEFVADEHELIGLYFSAHWCPPCKGFTPVLAKYYNNVKANGGSLEIIFISSDRDQSAFNEYFSEMPWLALKFEDQTAKETLSKKYGVSGIPTLVLLNKDGTLNTKDGRSVVAGDPEGKKFGNK